MHLIDWSSCRRNTKKPSRRTTIYLKKWWRLSTIQRSLKYSTRSWPWCTGKRNDSPGLWLLNSLNWNRIIYTMENAEKSSNVVYKRGNTPFLPFEPVENLAKKRPSSTKLDLVSRHPLRKRCMKSHWSWRPTTRSWWKRTRSWKSSTREWNPSSWIVRILSQLFRRSLKRNRKNWMVSRTTTSAGWSSNSTTRSMIWEPR